MMENIQESLWQQMGASIEMLKNAIKRCPQEHWDTRQRFWYHCFHTLFFLDYYLSTDPTSFEPPPPFTHSEFEDRMPERTYTQEELLEYAAYCEAKAKSLIESMTEETLQSRWVNQSRTMDYAVLEIVLYNMRHVQHHVGQLNLLLRQSIDDAPDWVFQAKG